MYHFVLECNISSLLCLLAKFLKLEQLEQDLDLAETPGVSVDGTGRVGTYFYTAPEIEQGWVKINEKVYLLLLYMYL